MFHRIGRDSGVIWLAVNAHHAAFDWIDTCDGAQRISASGTGQSIDTENLTCSGRESNVVEKAAAQSFDLQGDLTTGSSVMSGSV